jgi:hypothetical protein
MVSTPVLRSRVHVCAIVRADPITLMVGHLRYRTSESYVGKFKLPANQLAATTSTYYFLLCCFAFGFYNIRTLNATIGALLSDLLSRHWCS